MSSSPLTVQTITMGYSDSEDRLWLRVVLTDQNEARFWLTRRLLIRLCGAIADLLVKSYAKENEHELKELGEVLSQAKLAAEFEQAKDRLTETEAPPLSENPSPYPVGICHSVDITPGSPRWTVVWKVASTPGYSLAMDKVALLKLTAGLIEQAKRNGWNFPKDIETKLSLTEG